MRGVNALLKRRRAVAQRFAGRLSELPAVTAVLVFGSVALGQVDDASDIDLLVVCEPDIPDLEVRRACVSALGEGWTFGLTTDDPLFPVIDECRAVAGVPVTLHYQTSFWINGVLDEVLTHGAVTTERLPFRPYTLAGLLHRTWIIEDRQGIAAAWRTRTDVFPPVLKQNLLAHFVPRLREHAEELMTSARRRIGTVAFIFHLNGAVDALVGVLYALNGVYDLADKRAERVVWPHFQVAPENFSKRLTNVLEGPFDDATAVQKAERFRKLVDEVLESVNRDDTLHSS